ncbi:hypothetical protein [Terriglobus tenax]|uniref:hypothetical protein n=1 Tax=Terriglobus tenax TaxID=1111115 RepID=UPI0021E02763|nr:hypothetical protein [Terriglobus tenax]
MSGPTEHIHSHPASSSVTAPESGKKSLSIWFFVGILCLGYGLVLLPIGIYQFSHPPAVVLAELHATFWWGILMTLFGGFYTFRFRP